MTDIFTVSIGAVEGAALRGRVHLINSDVPFVSHEPTFPLTLLVDAWHLLSNGYLRDGDGMPSHRDRCPLSTERGKEIVAGMRLKNEFAELYDLLMGKKIRVDEAGYLLADDAKTVLRPRRRAARVYQLRDGSEEGRDELSRYVVGKSDPAEFSRRAAQIVTSYEVGSTHNVPLWREAAAHDVEEEPWEPEDQEELKELDGETDLSDRRVWMRLRTRPFTRRPYVDISVTVNDDGYLEHLADGMRWSTAHTGYGY